MSIPKRIFTVWLATDGKVPSLVSRCVESQRIPGYEHVLLTLPLIKGFGPYAFPFEESAYMREAWEAGNWVRMADYMRLYYLHKFGGIYLDGDFEVLPGKNFDGLLKYPLFAGREINGYIGFSALGSEPQNPLFAEQLQIVERNYRGSGDSGDVGFACSMQLFNDLIRTKYQAMPHYICPRPVLFPYDHQGGTIELNDTTIAYHHFMKTWKPEGALALVPTPTPTPDPKEAQPVSTRQKFSVVVIARNEIKTLPKLLASLVPFQQRGGEVVVLDTGSSDGTAELARQAGCVVGEVGDRFRVRLTEEEAVAINARFVVGNEGAIVKAGDDYFAFDAARNHAASLSSNKWICYADADEMFSRLDVDKIEDLIQNDELENLEYEFIFAHDPYGKPAVRFRQSKFYDRTKLEWRHIVHECLFPVEGRVPGGNGRHYMGQDVFLLEHFQNHETGRHTYLKGLAVDCFNRPKDDRASHYLARELFWAGHPKSALREFERHITLGGWAAERGQSYVFMGHCLMQLGDEGKAIECWHKAFLIEPKRREPLMMLAWHFLRKNDPHSAAAYASAALVLPEYDFYANNISHYTHEPHEILYWALCHLGDRNAARLHFDKCIAMQPGNPKYRHEAINFYEYVDKGIEGWMSFEELQWLYSTAKTVGPIAEVGSWKGRSTHALLSGCTRGIVTAIDHFRGSAGEDIAHAEAKKDVDTVYNQFLENVKGFKNLNVLRMTGAEASKLAGTYEMVFLDAGHTYDEVVADIRQWRGKATKILCGHDYSNAWEGVMRAVNEELGGPDEVHGSIWVKWVRG